MDAWMLDELAHAGDEHLDPQFVAGYDRKQGSVPDDTAAEDIEILARHGLDASATVVDLGAGTGRFALAAAERFGHVVAVDVSPAMHAFLREQVADVGRTNITCVHAGWLSYQHEGAPADAVYSRNALHQLPDFWKAIALERVSRVLRPRGVLRLRDLIYDFDPVDAGEVFGRWLDGAATDPAAGYTSDDLIQHIRTEHSTFTWLLEPMLERAGFDIVDVSDGTVYGAYTCVRR
jgi:ubiquinone/menaquinone biosynthesis C-methylase UbiE